MFRKFVASVLLVVASISGPTALHASPRTLDPEPVKTLATKAENREAALRWIAKQMQSPEFRNLVAFLELARDRQLANAGDCHALYRIILRLDPASVSRWHTIIEHEGANFWHDCDPNIAQFSGGPGRGPTQQTIGWNDDHGGKVTRYWHGLYYELGLNPNVDWRDAYHHMRVSILHKNRHGWSAWNGAF